MPTADFTSLVTGLPEADIPIPGVRAWILSAHGRQVLFFESEPGRSVPEHQHEEQWGVVVEGEMDLTIAGETRRLVRGDSYHIPGGAPHGATFRTRFRAIDIFGNPQRYQPKAG
jgi:quercetin dioxygenase-like cupin family protein